MAVQESTVIFQYKLDKIVQVYESDSDLTTILTLNGLYLDYGDDDINYPYNPDTPDIPYPPRTAFYENIISVFINNSTEIADTIITDLLSVAIIRAQIDSFFSEIDPTPISDEIYRQLLFSFKYGTVNGFFKENYHNFMPAYDNLVVQNNEKMKLWQEAFMQEFDRFAQIIDDIKDINNIDTVAEEYLEYIAQLVGFERGDTNLGDALFREITKNIIEVYRIKGTNYSFELFFNFIGFNIEIIEYWFDKRFYLDSNSVNPYTKETSPYKFAYYLTPNKPTEVILDNMSSPFVVMENELTSIRNGLTFDKDMEEGSLSELERYLDIEGTPDADMDYTYFKTNVVEYSISKITSDEIPEGLTEEDETTIQSYTSFLTPIFISKKVVISITPFEDDASITLLFKDADINGVSQFDISRAVGTILTLKVSYDYYYNNREDELWVMDFMENFKTSYIQELNVWGGGYKNWDNMNLLHEAPLYNDLDENLDGFSISYPYIENKPDTTLDFTLYSSVDALEIEPTFYNDSVVFIKQSTHYIGSGGGLTFADDTIARAGLNSTVISGLIIASSEAGTRVVLKPTVAVTQINVVGEADTNPGFRPVVGNYIISTITPSLVSKVNVNPVVGNYIISTITPSLVSKVNVNPVVAVTQIDATGISATRYTTL